MVTEGNSIGPAVQQNRDIYTITWANIDISPTTLAGANQLEGDIPLLASWTLEGLAESTTPNMWQQGFWLALRSKDRGPLFQAYANLSDEQNPTGITITAFASSAFATDTTSATGRIVQYSAGGVLAMANQSTINFLGTTLATDWIGSYRAFVRYRVSSGSDGDMRMQLRTVSAGRVNDSDTVPLLALGLWTVADCGVVTIPGGPVPGATDILDTFGFGLRVENTVAAARVADFMDLILLPADEWLGYFYRDNPGQYLIAESELRIDSAITPRYQLTAWEYEGTPLKLVYSYVRYATGPTILQSNPGSNGLQGWFLMSGEDSAGATTEPIVSPTYTVRVEVSAAHRYLSMRGDR